MHAGMYTSVPSLHNKASISAVDSCHPLSFSLSPGAPKKLACAPLLQVKLLSSLNRTHELVLVLLLQAAGRMACADDMVTGVVTLATSTAVYCLQPVAPELQVGGSDTDCSTVLQHPASIYIHTEAG
jgi:hypothetical protein